MQVPSEHAEEFATFPKELRTLVLSELAAGNAIVELAHSFPAAPCGAYIMLAHAVTARARPRPPCHSTTVMGASIQESSRMQNVTSSYWNRPGRQRRSRT